MSVKYWQHPEKLMADLKSAQEDINQSQKVKKNTVNTKEAGKHVGPFIFGVKKPFFITSSLLFNNTIR